MEARLYYCAKLETLAPRAVVTDTWMVVSSLMWGKNESLNSAVCCFWHQLSRDRESYFPTNVWKGKSRPSVCSPLDPLGLEGAYYQPVGMRVLVPCLDSLTPPLQGCWGDSSVSWGWGSRFLSWHWLDQMGGGPQFVWDVCNRAVIVWKFSVLIDCPFPG